MRCPFCNADKENLKVIDSRTCDGEPGDPSAARVQRTATSGSPPTSASSRPIRLMVVKKDGRRVPWDRAKILAGLERACFKRPVPESELLRIADEVEDEVFNAPRPGGAQTA